MIEIQEKYKCCGCAACANVCPKNAIEMVEDKGVIFGVAFDTNFNLEHQKVETKEDLEKLRGAKYLQSNINELYRKTKEILNEGRKVLFTETPC